MIIEYYAAIADQGGAIGAQFSSGDIGAILPKLTTQNMIDGITIQRKIYIKNIRGTSTIYAGLEVLGLFNAAMFDSTGDAQIASEITGTEDKYGGAKITKAIDSNTNEETENGAGSLTDIKKVVVEKNPLYTFFRTGEPIIVNQKIGEILAIIDLATHWEIELTDSVPYGYVIDKNAFSALTGPLTVGTHKPYWIEVVINPGEVEQDHFNKIKLGIII